LGPLIVILFYGGFQMSKFTQSNFAYAIGRRLHIIAISALALLFIALLVFFALSKPVTIITTINIAAQPTNVPQPTPAPTAQPTQAPAAVAQNQIKAEEPITTTTSKTFNLVDLAPKGTVISKGDRFPGGMTFTEINGAVDQLVSVIERHGEKAITFLATDGTDSSDSGDTTITFDRPVNFLQFYCYDNDPKAGEEGWSITVNGIKYTCDKQTQNRKDQWMDINQDGVTQVTIRGGGDSGGFNFTFMKSTTTVKPHELPNTGAEDINLVNYFPIFAIILFVIGYKLTRKTVTV
jgi:hypothetical protein